MRKQEKSRILYSDKKIKAKNAPEYSVLKPETNSDSASEKSNGARCVSAKVQTSQEGRSNRRIAELDWKELRVENEVIANTIATKRVLNTDS